MGITSGDVSHEQRHPRLGGLPPHEICHTPTFIRSRVWRTSRSSLFLPWDRSATPIWSALTVAGAPTTQRPW